MPGKCVHKQATSRGAGNIRLTLGNDTNYCWTLRGFYIQFAATFSAICTVSYSMANHEGNTYDVVMYSATVATADTIVQTHIYAPSQPLVFRGKDACVITIGGASAANQFNYVAVLQEQP